MSNKYKKSTNRRINIKKRIESKTKIKDLLLTSLLILIVLMITGCSHPFYVPGASMGYFLWQTEDGNYHLRWSNDWDRNAPNNNLRKFSGSIKTDGIITIKNSYQWEGEKLTKDIENVDIIKVEPSRVEFIAYTTNLDFEDGIDFSVDKGTYLEFNLKNNDIYDLGRISLGSFANSPEEEIFRILKDELLYEAKKPFYLKHPFSTFFNKLSYDRVFTNIYLLLMGIIVVELIRVSILLKRKNYKKLTYISYTLLFLFLIIINIMLLRYS
ncbi:MAG: hypothetical protein KKC53_01455 [Actinobacteria bacterium]|nr:hypothetical protein [Actinomycetota bacterium]